MDNDNLYQTSIILHCICSDFVCWNKNGSRTAYLLLAHGTVLILQSPLAEDKGRGVPWMPATPMPVQNMHLKLKHSAFCTSSKKNMDFSISAGFGEKGRRRASLSIRISRHLPRSVH
ncbi:unnamed protein product, partial [Sphacelaria rigidula]